MSELLASANHRQGFPFRGGVIFFRRTHLATCKVDRLFTTLTSFLPQK
jgi:hypothetical protein